MQRSTVYFLLFLFLGMALSNCQSDKKTEVADLPVNKERLPAETEESPVEFGNSKFISPDGDFVINFPSEPVRRTDVVNAEGGSIDINIFSYEVDSGTAYWLSYSDHKDSDIGGDPLAFIQKVMQEIATNIDADAKIVADEAITLKSNPGISFMVNANDSFFGAYKLILVENRLYQLGIIKLYGFPSENEKDSFLESFDLL